MMFQEVVTAEPVTHQEVAVLATYGAVEAPMPLLEACKIPRKRRLEIIKVFEAFGKIPTLTEVDYFKQIIEGLEREITERKKEADFTMSLAKEFWGLVKAHQAVKIQKSLGRHGARSRKFVAKSSPL